METYTLFLISLLMMHGYETQGNELYVELYYMLVCILVIYIGTGPKILNLYFYIYVYINHYINPNPNSELYPMKITKYI